MKNKSLSTIHQHSSKPGILKKGTLLTTALVSIPTALMMFPTSAFAECIESVPNLYICAVADSDGIAVGDGKVVSVLPAVTVDNVGADIITVGEKGRITLDGGLVGSLANSANALVLGAGSSVEIVDGSARVTATTNAITFNAPGDAFDGTPENSVINEGAITGDILSNGTQNETITNRAGASISGNLTMADGNNTTTNSGVIFGNITGGSGNDAVTNGATGTLTGNLTLGDGDNGVVNAGTLTGDVTTGSGIDTYTNSGTHTGDVDLGAGDNTVSTSGTLTGDLTAGSGDDTYTNSGTHTGNADLGDGDNTATIAGGFLIGNLDTGTGDDTVTVAAAGTVGNVNMGDGTNTGTVAGTVLGHFNGGAGDDTVTIAAGGSVGAGLALGNGNNTLDNSGDVTGDITMGDGDDTITTDGTITGNIAMGAGTNTITFNADSALPTGTLTADATGDNTLNLGGTGTDTFNISVTNFDTMNKNGTGTWTLDAFDNSFANGININAGKLIANGTSRFGANDIVNNAMAEINEGAAGTYSGDMSGTGSLEKTGAGTATLSGTNTFTGGTTVTAGTLSVTGGSALADDGAVTVGAAGTLAVTEAETVGSLTGAAGSQMTLTETLTTGGLDTDTTFAGVASGAGGLTKVGTGTMTLSGANTYTGTTTVNGGTLSVTGGAAIADTGAVSVGADGTLAVAASETIGSLAGSGSATVATGQTLSTGAADTDTTFSGVISGEGALTKVGTGNFTVTGANTYSGGTTVTAGTLTGTTTSLQGDITNNAALAFDQDTDGTYADVVSGTGSLTKLGTGKVTISGANTYSGGTTVTAGTLAGTTTSIQGNVTNNATLMFEQDTDGTYAGIVSGTGELTKAGSGNVTLTGANTYDGGTNINGGTLTVASTSLLGAASTAVTFDGGTLAITGADTSDRDIILNTGGGTVSSDNDLTLSGVISGVGGFTKAGTGTTILTGTNTYSGGTTVSGGILQGSAESVQGDIVNNAAVHFTTAADETYAGNMSGTGEVTKTGAGNLTMSGTNSYSGGTTVTEGTLTGDSDSLQGDIVNNAAVVFDQAGEGTYAGDLSGTGTLTKSGVGTLTTTGDINHTGGTAVSGGRLNVNGTLTSDVTVGSGAALGGSGTITGDITSTGGTIAAGNSIGTLNITGDLNMDADSSMEVELAANGAGMSGDLVAVDGNASIDGTVTLVSAKGLYQNGATHNFVTASTGNNLNGTFDTVNGLKVNNFVTLAVSYSGTAATVTTSRRAYVAAASTANQKAVAGALDSGVAGATGDFATALIEVDYLGSDGAAATAYDHMSPEAYGSFVTSSQKAGDAFLNAATNHWLAGGADSNGGWIQGYGSWSSMDTEDDLQGYDTNLYGVAAGFEGSFGDGMRGGIMAGYSSTDIDTEGLVRTGEMDSYQIGAYVGGESGNINYLVSGFYGNNDGDMTRTISYGGVSRTAMGKVEGNEFRVSGRISMALGNDANNIKPFVALEYSSLKMDAFTETGADSLNLSVDEMKGDRFLGSLGISYQGDMGGFHPVAHVAYRYAFDQDDRLVGASFAGGGSTFTVAGQENGSGSVVFGAGVVGSVSDTVTIFVNYNGEISNLLSSHSGSAGLRFQF